MEQILIWGTGQVFSQNIFEIRELVNDGAVEIIALVDERNANKIMEGYKVVDKQEIKNFKWDKILVAAEKAADSIRQDIAAMGIDDSKVDSIFHYLKKYYSRRTEKQLEVLQDILKASDEEVSDYQWMYQKISEYGVFPFPRNLEDTKEKVTWSALGVLQTIEEFTEFCDYICNLDVKTAIEIGVYKGRSSYFMCALLSRKNPNLKYILVDIKDNLDEYERYKEVLPALDKRIPSTSDDYAGENYDFVFIDADHSYDASIKDYMNCGQYANKVTVFHDIFCHEYDEQNGGIVRTWQEVVGMTKNQKHRIFTRHQTDWMGIGVIEWNK